MSPENVRIPEFSVIVHSAVPDIPRAEYRFQRGSVVFQKADRT
jgi:hypothetical protein